MINECLKKCILAILICLIAAPGWAVTYTIGSGETYETFTALEAAIVLAGDDIVDGKNETFRETWTPATGGTAGHPIILRNAVIMGSTADDGSGWTGPDGNTEYYKTYETEPSVVVRDGVRLKKGTVGSLATNEWGYSATEVYVKENPSGYTYEISQRTAGISLGPYDNITIDNVDISTTTSWAVRAGGADNITIENCDFSFTGSHAISTPTAVRSTWVIDSNTFTGCNNYLYIVEVDGLTFSNNTVTECGSKYDISPGDGALSEVLYGTSDSDNITFTGNTYSNNGDFSLSDTYSSLVIKSCATTGLVSNNSFSNEGGTAILIEYQASAARAGITISDNTIDDAYAGISLVDTSGSTVTRNTIKNCVNANVATGIFLKGNNDNTTTASNVIQGNVIKNCGKSGQANSGGIRFQKVTSANTVANNTVDQCENGLIFTELGGAGDATTGQTVKNLIISNSNNDHVIVGDNSSSTIDKNLYYPDTGTMFSYHGSDYNYADWKTNSSQDGNSPNVGNPLFVNAGNNDYRIKPGSPAEEAGTPIGAVTLDINNNYRNPTAPDIGAYEVVITNRGTGN